MTEPIRFTIDGTPKGKARVHKDPRHNFRSFKDDKTARQELDIGKLCRAAMRSRQPLTGAVKLTIDVVFAIPQSWPRVTREAALRGEIYHTQKPDCDNIAKLAKDSVNKIAWHDDSQVAVELIRKRFGTPARTDITIEELAAASATTPATPSENRRIKRAVDMKLGRIGRTAKPHNAVSAKPHFSVQRTPKGTDG